MLGYALRTLSSGEEVLDLSRPYKGSDQLSVDAFAGYTFRDMAFLGVKSKWKVQVNVRNLLARRGLIPANALTDGTHSIVTYRTPQQFIFSLDVDL
jgi:hypothetical protein